MDKTSTTTVCRASEVMCEHCAGNGSQWQRIPSTEKYEIHRICEDSGSGKGHWGHCSFCRGKGFISKPNNTSITTPTSTTFWKETVCRILFFVPNGVNNGWTNFSTPVRLAYNRHGNLQVEDIQSDSVYVKAYNTWLRRLIFNRKGECLNFTLPKAAPEHRKTRLI
jgi:DnaJ-class molecular chaperone